MKKRTIWDLFCFETTLQFRDGGHEYFHRIAKPNLLHSWWIIKWEGIESPTWNAYGNRFEVRGKNVRGGSVTIFPWQKPWLECSDGWNDIRSYMVRSDAIALTRVSDNPARNTIKQGDSGMIMAPIPILRGNHDQWRFNPFSFPHRRCTIHNRFIRRLGGHLMRVPCFYCLIRKVFELLLFLIFIVLWFLLKLISKTSSKVHQ